MKNFERYLSIENRSNPYRRSKSIDRIEAAVQVWSEQNGMVNVAKVAKIMNVCYDTLVDAIVAGIHSYYPEITFEPKRKPIEPLYDYDDMARLEAGAYVSHHEQMTFEAFYYLANNQTSCAKNLPKPKYTKLFQST